MGIHAKRPSGATPGMRLDLARPRTTDAFRPPGGCAQMRGDKLHSSSSDRQPQLGHRSEARPCGSGTSLVLLVVLAAFLIWVLN